MRPPTPTPSRWRFVLAVYAYSALLALIAAALCLVGPLHGLGPLRVLIPEVAMCGVVGGLWVVADLVPVSLPYRGDTYAFVLEEVPLLFGLVFLSPDLLVLSTVCAVAFTFTVLRRQALLKMAFNVASTALATALAATVFREILGTHSPVSLVGWAAAAAALVTGQVTWALTLRVVTMLNGQKAKQRTGIILLAIQAMLVAASLCLAFAFLDAAWHDPWTTLPLVVVAILIIVAFRGYARLRLRFLSLQHLYDFSRTMGIASLDPSSMSVDVLREVCTVMRARRAELILAEPSGIPRRISFDERGASGIEPITLDEGSIVTQTIATGEASLYNSATQDHSAHRRPDCGRVPRRHGGPSHEPAHGDRRHRRPRSRRGAGQFR